MAKEIMYKGLAKYYDFIYSWKDYKKDAIKLNSLISKYKKSSGSDMLDVACGTGKHLGFFDINKTVKIIEKENISAKFLKKGLMKERGIYIGVKK